MRELGGRLIFHKWKDKEEGWSIEGVYRGTRIDQFDKVNYILEDDDGQRHNLNSCGSLDHALDKGKMVNEGDRLLVKFLGRAAGETKYGYRDDILQLKVFLLDDEERSLDDLEELDDEEETFSLDDLK